MGVGRRSSPGPDLSGQGSCLRPGLLSQAPRPIVQQAAKAPCSQDRPRGSGPASALHSIGKGAGDPLARLPVSPGSRGTPIGPGPGGPCCWMLLSAQQRRPHFFRFTFPQCRSKSAISSAQIPQWLPRAWNQLQVLWLMTELQRVPEVLTWVPNIGHIHLSGENSSVSHKKPWTEVQALGQHSRLTLRRSRPRLQVSAPAPSGLTQPTPAHQTCGSAQLMPLTCLCGGPFLLFLPTFPQLLVLFPASCRGSLLCSPSHSCPSCSPHSFHGTQDVPSPPWA